MAELTYPWQRFWVPSDGSIDLSDGGFLRDPNDWMARPQGLAPLAALQPWRSLALLGEPGIGKSTALKEEADRIAALPVNAGCVPSTSIYGRSPATRFFTGGFSKAKNSLRGRAAAHTCFFISTASTKRCSASIRSPICSPRSYSASRPTACRFASPAGLPCGRRILLEPR